MAGRLQGKVALVTGASRGIGAAIARRFGEEGADVAISYNRSPGPAEAVTAAVRDAGGRAEAIQADAADPAATRALVAEVVRRLGRLDILVNNAGQFAGSTIDQDTDEAFDQMIALNVRGVFVAAGAAAKVMGEGGRIINIGSVLGARVPMPSSGLYAMSKFAVAGFTRAWARDLAPRGITVNCIQPGPIETDMNPAEGDFADFLKRGVALGRYGQPSDIASAAAYLASPEASYVTGAMLNVDGGFEA